MCGDLGDIFSFIQDDGKEARLGCAWFDEEQSLLREPVLPLTASPPTSPHTRSGVSRHRIARLSRRSAPDLKPWFGRCSHDVWPLSLHLSLHLLCTAFDYNLFGQGLVFGFSRVVEIRSGTSLLLDFWVPVSVGQLPFLSTDIVRVFVA